MIDAQIVPQPSLPASVGTPSTVQCPPTQARDRPSGLANQRAARFLAPIWRCRAVKQGQSSSAAPAQEWSRLPDSWTGQTQACKPLAYAVSLGDCMLAEGRIVLVLHERGPVMSRGATVAFALLRPVENRRSR